MLIVLVLQYNVLYKVKCTNLKPNFWESFRVVYQPEGIVQDASGLLDYSEEFVAFF